MSRIVGLGNADYTIPGTGLSLEQLMSDLKERYGLVVRDWSVSAYPADPWAGKTYNDVELSLSCAVVPDLVKREKRESKEEKKVAVRGLYMVYVVDPRSDNVWCWGPKVATSDESARMKAIRDLKFPDDFDPDVYDVKAIRLMDVRDRKSL